MKSSGALIVFLSLILITALPSSLSASAYSTSNVPVDDSVYRDLDKLIAFGLIKDAIYGQRPWSRKEIARMILEAEKNSEDRGLLTPDDREISKVIAIDDLLRRLKSDYREELSDSPKTLRIYPLESVRFDYTFLDSPSRAVPQQNGLGEIEARINPLVAYREGRHYVDGNTLGLETAHVAQLTKYASLYVRPRLEVLVPNTGSNKINAAFQQLYGKFAYKNFEIQAGRDSLVWGQGEFGGLLFSNNARPLDMIKLGNSSPFFLPWIFRHLGLNAIQVFFADLGPERILPRAILSGFKWTLKPFSFLEMGLNHAITMGGRGADDPSVAEAIGEFTGVFSAFTKNKQQTADTNRLFSLDARLTLPFVRNAVVYGEIGFEDMNKELKVLFEDNAAYAFGLYFPTLTNEGDLDLRFEYQHIPGGVYRHGRYLSGHVLNGRILGSELGPDGDSIAAKINYDINPSSRWTTLLSYERRDSDHFGALLSGSELIDIIQTQNNPAEHRFRGRTNLSWRCTKKIRVEMGAGYEHVWNAGFVRSNRGNNVTAMLGVNFTR